MYSLINLLLDYSEESIHGTWGTISYFQFLDQIWVAYGEHK